MIFNRILTYILAGVLILCAGLLVIQTVRLFQAQRTVLQYEKLQLDATTAAAVARSEVRSTEAGLKAAYEVNRRALNDQVKTLSHTRDILYKRLRVAETNTPCQVSSAASHPDAGTAPQRGVESELHGPVVPTELDEAYRADLIRVHLLNCQTQYEQVREMLKR